MLVKRVLLTGASGLLGRAIYKCLTDVDYQKKYPLTSQDLEIKWTCLGLCHSRVKGDLRKCDLNNFAEIDQIIDEFKPDVILHCAAERRIENVEGNFEKAMQLNKGTTEHLAQISAKLGLLFIYISTDYVFDGTKPPYKIDDEPNPLNKYGISKLFGETVTKNASPKHVIIRVPVLYGFTEPQKYEESAVNILIEKLRKQEPFKVDNFQLRYPTHTADVSRFCVQMMTKYFQASSDSTQVIKGIFHCSGPQAYTKYDMACIMADIYNLPKEHIIEDKSEANKTAPSLRPDNSTLDTSYSNSVIDFKPIMEFKDCIKDCLENFD